MLPVLGAELTHAEDGTKTLLLLQKTLSVATPLCKHVQTIAQPTAGKPVVRWHGTLKCSNLEATRVQARVEIRERTRHLDA